ncbi:hypothetical protein GGR50DRAFT_475142 [Xylaria sp. CBS 124048]|nr:hypothetical protein GGR50DRAFT_475142 [Xylaria sp. CBS 124048]
MRFTIFALNILGAVGASARHIDSRDATLTESISSFIVRDEVVQNRPRDTYPINCHLHNWPSASVDSVKQAYSWFYELISPLEADGQQCRRIACYGTSGVWLCADSLGYESPNSVTIADQMNDLLDGDHGCLDEDNKNMVQGQIFSSDGWSVLVRGGEDCSADVAEQPLFY